MSTFTGRLWYKGRLPANQLAAKVLVVLGSSSTCNCLARRRPTTCSRRHATVTAACPDAREPRSCSGWVWPFLPQVLGRPPQCCPGQQQELGQVPVCRRSAAAGRQVRGWGLAQFANHPVCFTCPVWEPQINWPGVGVWVRGRLGAEPILHRVGNKRKDATGSNKRAAKVLPGLPVTGKQLLSAMSSRGVRKKNQKAKTA